MGLARGRPATIADLGHQAPRTRRPRRRPARAGGPEGLVAGALGGVEAGYHLTGAMLAEAGDAIGGTLEFVPPVAPCRRPADTRQRPARPASATTRADDVPAGRRREGGHRDRRRGPPRPGRAGARGATAGRDPGRPRPDRRSSAADRDEDLRRERGARRARARRPGLPGRRQLPARRHGAARGAGGAGGRARRAAGGAATEGDVRGDSAGTIGGGRDRSDRLVGAARDERQGRAGGHRTT